MVRAAAFITVFVGLSVPSYGALTSLAGAGFTADGAFQGVGLSPTEWSISFEFDGDLSASSTMAEFGAWSFRLANGSQQWVASGESSVAGSWTNIAGARVFTIDLADASTGGSGTTLLPTPTSVSIVYSAVRTAGVWSSLGDALRRSQGVGFDASRGGFIVRTSGSGPFGESTVTSGYLVPSPGAAALVGLAGMLGQRRRS